MKGILFIYFGKIGQCAGTLNQLNGLGLMDLKAAVPQTIYNPITVMGVVDHLGQYVNKIRTKECPKTVLKCFALDALCSKAKHLKMS